MAVSFLITGLINSRLSEIGGFRKLEIAYRILKDIDNSNELIISTYRSEVSQDIINLVDRVVFVDDPGFDRFRLNPWPIGRPDNRHQANYSRIFEATIAGLKVVSNDLIIKSRIELIPENIDNFRIWLGDIISLLTNSSLPKIAFLTEHYNGVFFSVDGTLGTLPNTLQAAKRSVLQQTWTNAYDFWTQNKHILTRSKMLFPITDEQITGLTYLRLFSNFEINQSRIRRFKRYYISLPLLKSIIFAERNLFIWAKYYRSGLSTNRFRGTYFIDTKEVGAKPMKSNSQTILKLIIIIKLKKFKHIIRRITANL